MRIQTITVKGQDGKALVINSDDFDASKHEIYGADDIVKGEQPPAEPQQVPGLQPAAPVTHDANGNPVNAGDGGQMVPAAQTTTPPGNAELMLVQKKGKKFVVVNLAGEEVERDGIVKGGYASEDEARAAITAATTPAA